MIKVLYLINYAGKAGSEKYVLSLMDKLKGKVEPHLAYSIDGLLRERAEKRGIKTMQLDMKNILDIKAAKKLAEYCKENDIDIVHAQFMRENYIASLAKLFNRNIKVFYTSHFVLRNNLVQKMFNMIQTKIQDRVIAICTSGREMLINNKVDKNKIDIIYNGVDVDEEINKVSTLRTDLEIDEDTTILFCGSRFSHEKGHRFLIESLKQLKSMINKKFKLILANEGELLKDIKVLVNELGMNNEVEFVGFVEDIDYYLLGSDIYVSPSATEALSFAIIEALAKGLPVVSTDVGGCVDIINDQTDCGLLVEYENCEDMAGKMKIMIEDVEKRKQFKMNARKAAFELFSSDVMADKTYELYEKSIKGDM